MSEIKEIYSKKYYEYLKNRSKIRKWLRLYYLRDINKYCIGKTIDFGCGVGELLKILPEDSIGNLKSIITTEIRPTLFLMIG